MKNREEVTYTVGEGEDQVEKTIYIIRPKGRVMREAKMAYSRAFSKALTEGAILEARLNDYMREQGIWNDQKQKRLVKILEELAQKISQLEAGGITKAKGRELAIDIRVLRSDWSRLVGETNDLKENTAEGIADNAQFDFLVTKCIVDEEGVPLFDDIEEYYEQGDEEHVMKAAGILANMYTNYDPEYSKQLPENKFLKKYNFVNDDLFLVNDDGKLVDEFYNVIEETEEEKEEEAPEPVFYDTEEEIKEAEEAKTTEEEEEEEEEEETKE